ncbi:MAG: hypothetical protein KBT02_00645 [Treponema sp.]|nr:hypothetical protein [Candidatus Treponema caballi]
MPWRLILFAVFLVLLVVFVGVNLDNKCAVSLIFVTYPDVPVYISILIAFALGMLIMIPFTFGRRSSRSYPDYPERNPIASTKKPAARKTGAAKKPAAAEEDEQPVARPINDD